MRAQLVAAVRTILVVTVLCGIAYPLLVTGIAQVGFGDRADGSLIRRNGAVVGSRLLGQAFTGDEYFQSRPSSAGAAASGSWVAPGQPADPTDLALVASSASNQGPTNPDLLASVEDRADAYRARNGLAEDAEVPVDAVTATGSGLDPDISVANARLQAPRVAHDRGLDLELVLDLVDRHTTARAT